VPIAGLYVPAASGRRFDPARAPAFRTPLPDLNVLGSPYQARILDVADEQMLLLETIRGCRFQCKFCYYPKSYDKLYFVSDAAVRQELEHAVRRGAREVVLLDPTLNQRKDFAEFLRLLAAGNPGQRFHYFGELRAEGITAVTAALLRQANFTEVEVGLQSVGPQAMSLMARNNNLRSFERGVRALLREGIKVKVDLIVGLPGDNEESIRGGMRYLRDEGLYSDVQVFQLSILPGTAFRHEAAALGLTFQPRPPYYVLRTPTLSSGDIMGLMQEAQEFFEVEFDAPPPPVLKSPAKSGLIQKWVVDLDAANDSAPAGLRAQAFTLWLRSKSFLRSHARAAAVIKELLHNNPFMTLQVVLEPITSCGTQVQETIDAVTVSALMEACQEQPTYLDKYFAMQPGRATGAKRFVVVVPSALEAKLPQNWLPPWCEITASDYLPVAGNTLRA
jgi:hypothetical protein